MHVESAFLRFLYPDAAPAANLPHMTLMQSPPIAPGPPRRASRGRARVWTVMSVLTLLIVGTPLLSRMGVYAIANLYRRDLPPPDRYEAVMGLVSNVHFIAAVYAVLFLLYTLSAGACLAASRRVGPGFALLRPPRASGLAILLLIVGGVAWAEMMSLALWATGAHSRALESISTMLAVGKQTPGSLLPLVLMVAVLGPAVEELLFRGYVQPRLVRRWGAWVGVGVTSVAFGLYHRDWIQGGWAVLIGLYMGSSATAHEASSPRFSLTWRSTRPGWRASFTARRRGRLWRHWPVQRRSHRPARPISCTARRSTAARSHRHPDDPPARQRVDKLPPVGLCRDPLVEHHDDAGV